ncbi:2-oxoglutarate and iron-dependent oxygenase domain-containing protein CP2-like isoform X2 [Amaranthus tricolor]|uniref:2-oxoglutarate and iron-dependent oxygenase domain-containing protein CP2-like isoform X2 n=1 Tax=Amaranthus tricolor TaxID=29722 RepID=UPI002584E6CB|nr:2-oxoglutarate and iron-dependent oxygenase domain-containing protein CP2-like isoform X2 [Amaranthus tricolor]
MSQTPNPNPNPCPSPSPSPNPNPNLHQGETHQISKSPSSNMSIDGTFDQRREQAPVISARNGNENGVIASKTMASTIRLSTQPNAEHKPESYEDLSSEFSPLLFSCLERYLPPSVLTSSRDSKVQVMRNILLKYSPEGERIRTQKYKEYKTKIMTNYQPLHKELYSMHASNFFVPPFLNAINENTEESFRNIMSEPAPGIFTFDMFQSQFCDMLLNEVENIENWVCETKCKIMRPNTMNRYGAVLDDFGLGFMLDKLMGDFVRPIAKGFHVDDAELTLNVCLGKEFSGGELFFRGVRCEKHVNTETQAEEILDYSHVPGRAVLHRGRHRHGARATTDGRRSNLILWCRSSVFRELKKYQKDFSTWCGECQREKKERKQLSVAATKEVYIWPINWGTIILQDNLLSIVNDELLRYIQILPQTCYYYLCKPHMFFISTRSFFFFERPNLLISFF